MATPIYTYNRISQKLQDGWETSTRKDNRFAQAIASIPWDVTFKADGEYYFAYRDYTFTTPSLDPFDVEAFFCKPHASFTDDATRETVIHTLGRFGGYKVEVYTD